MPRIINARQVPPFLPFLMYTVKVELDVFRFVA